jgi:hypothetical protein
METATQAEAPKRQATRNPAVLALRFRALAKFKALAQPMTYAGLAAALDVPERRLRRALRDERWARALRLDHQTDDDNAADRAEPLDCLFNGTVRSVAS